ncbi:putative hypothetical protein [Streptomyces sp. NBRC 110611]|uniref:M60 family metallopeptidase n=1 Tax=Streptomyces sp. NBRC 110611 TaxID=1621259 RepID=UPI0008581C1C|nr:M60 family metallopeptidase [Streptomyces sp. NBRC 110611]GAU70318.1 putative hypothetical protein [Streptomyces sp. NBRC 110611]
MAAAAVAAVMGATVVAADAAAVNPRPDRNISSVDTRHYTTELCAETFQLSAKPSPAKEQQRLKSSFRLSGAQSTGLHVPPSGRSGFAEVADTPDSRAGRVKLRIGVPGAKHDGGKQRVITLKPGTNRIGDETGGMLYLTVEGNSSATTSVEFAGHFAKVPRFVLGETSGENFRTMLDNSDAPWVEYVSERVIVTVDRATALKYRDQDPVKLMRTYDAIVRIQDRVNDVGEEGGSLAPSPLRQHIVLDGQKRKGTARTANGYTAFGPAHAGVLLSSGKLSRGETAWDIWRELSRPRQLKPVSGDGLGEAMAGIYAVQVERDISGLPLSGPRGWHTRTLAKLREAKPTLESVRGAVMLDQLALAYGSKDFWRSVNRLILEEEFPKPQRAQDALIMKTSAIAGEDLREFFAKWGVFPGEELGKLFDAMKFPKPRVDPFTLGGERKVSIVPFGQ